MGRRVSPNGRYTEGRQEWCRSGRLQNACMVETPGRAGRVALKQCGGEHPCRMGEGMLGKEPE